jgi:hypothetical protein
MFDTIIPRYLLFIIQYKKDFFIYYYKKDTIIKSQFSKGISFGIKKLINSQKIEVKSISLFYFINYNLTTI